MNARSSMQPVVFPDSGELIINDFQDNGDYLIVVDIKSGELLDRVKTGSNLANGMFLTPGGIAIFFIALHLLWLEFNGDNELKYFDHTLK